MKLLYYKKYVADGNTIDKQYNFKIIEFTPSLRKWYLYGEKREIKTTLVRFYFQIMTLGKAKLVCAVGDQGKVIHTSYVVPKCFKFSFIHGKDYVIGPCFTNPMYRGKGIYAKVLEYICSNVGETVTTFFMIVDYENKSSIKGVEKAGFKICGSVEKTRFFKRYYKL